MLHGRTVETFIQSLLYGIFLSTKEDDEWRRAAMRPIRIYDRFDFGQAR